MRLIRGFCVAAVLVGLFLNTVASIALADARNGELFGYRIGEAYQLTSKTIWRYESDNDPNTYIVAENPKKPPDIQQVRLTVSPQTRTIVEIAGITEFQSEDAMRRFLATYGATIRNLYPDVPWGAGVNDPSATYLYLSGKQFELSVRGFGGKEPWAVITMRPWDKRAERLYQSLKKEFDEGSRRRALKSGRAKGL